MENVMKFGRTGLAKTFENRDIPVRFKIVATGGKTARPVFDEGLFPLGYNPPACKAWKDIAEKCRHQKIYLFDWFDLSCCAC